MRPCPSILCQRIHRPEPDNIGYLKRDRNHVMVGLFGRQGKTSLSTMRYNTFSKNVVSAYSVVTTERLLSTECVTKLPFCRIYLQPGHGMTVSNVIKLFVSTIYTLSYSSPIYASSGIIMISSVIPDTVIHLRVFLTRKCLICPSYHGLGDFHHSLSLKCQYCFVPPTRVPIDYNSKFIDVWKPPNSRIMDSMWYLQLPQLPSNIVINVTAGTKRCFDASQQNDAMLDTAILDVAILGSSRW